MRLNNARTKGTLRRVQKPEEFNPMEGVGNMADAMLVFACGLILALIISWNVKMDETGAIKGSAQGQKYEITDYNNASSQQMDAENQLQEMGTVYQDVVTGKYYVIEGQ